MIQSTTTTFTHPGGESAREVLDRAWDALNDVFDAGHAMPLVVTHGNLMALVLHSDVFDKVAISLAPFKRPRLFLRK